MIYRAFGSLGWQVSAIGLGSWNLGNQWGKVDEATAFATVQQALDAGMNLIDTADAYGIPPGLSEDRVGRALAGRRHRVFIVSKAGNWGARAGNRVPITSADMVRLCAHASLHRLKTDYLDVLLCHIGNIEDPTLFLEGFEALVQEGRLRAYGISTDSLSVLKKFNVHNTCRVVQLNYSLLNRSPEAGLLDYCREHGIAVMVRGPLAMGLLSGGYAKDFQFTDTVREKWHDGGEGQAALDARLDQVEKLAKQVAPGADMITAALRYVISQPTNPVAIPGAKSPKQAAMNARAGAQLLSDEEKAKLLACLK